MFEAMIDDLKRKTKEYCGTWGYAHCQRVKRHILELGASKQYNEELLEIALWLHDWGAYPTFLEQGRDHVEKSLEVAAAYLGERALNQGLSQSQIKHILECIEVHHSGSEVNSIEAILLGDADRLDMLGIVGVMRDFSRNPKEMRTAYETAMNRAKTYPSEMILKSARGLAEQRSAEMLRLLKAFEEQCENIF